MNTPLTATAPSQSPTGQWILAVDDEPSMRMLMEVILRGQGWTVVSADGGNAALELLKVTAQPPAVVICDVLMPGIDGLDLVRRMCARIPELNVIFISGRLSDVSWWPTDLREHRFLAKPFEKSQLVGAVREALNTPSSG
jgi:two-component system, cell cycle sensor histidine kinase and response regulator CckA